MPERLAKVFGSMGAYVVWRPRIGLPPFEVCLYWSSRYADDPGNRWLRDLLVELFREP